MEAEPEPWSRDLRKFVHIRCGSATEMISFQSHRDWWSITVTLIVCYSIHWMSFCVMRSDGVKSNEYSFPNNNKKTLFLQHHHDGNNILAYQYHHVGKKISSEISLLSQVFLIETFVSDLFLSSCFYRIRWSELLSTFIFIALYCIQRHFIRLLLSC